MPKSKHTNVGFSKNKKIAYSDDVPSIILAKRKSSDNSLLEVQKPLDEITPDLRMLLEEILMRIIPILTFNDLK